MVAVSKTHHKHTQPGYPFSHPRPPKRGWWTKGGLPKREMETLDRRRPAGPPGPGAQAMIQQSTRHRPQKPDPTPHTRRRGCMTERWTPAGRTEAAFSYHTRGCASSATRNAAPVPGTIPWACEPSIVGKIAGAILRRSPLLSIGDLGRKGRRGTTAADVHPILLG